MLLVEINLSLIGSNVPDSVTSAFSSFIVEKGLKTLWHGFSELLLRCEFCVSSFLHVSFFLPADDRCERHFKRSDNSFSTSRDDLYSLHVECWNTGRICTPRAKLDLGRPDVFF